MIDKYEFLQDMCLVLVLAFGILSALSGFGWNYFGKKITQIKAAQQSQSTEKNTTRIIDTVESKTDKVIHALHATPKKVNQTNISAPNALIVTTNQKGDNTVNVTKFFSNTYHPVSENFINQFEKVWQEIKNKYENPPRISLEVEAGNSFRGKVAQDLARLINDQRYCHLQSNTVTNMGVYPGSPVTIACKPQYYDYATNLRDLIATYIDTEVFINASFDQNYIRFYINGNPSFDEEGKVKIE